MKSLAKGIGIALVLTVSACSQPKGALEIQAGSEVTLEKADGVKVAGRLVDVGAEQIVVETRDGVRSTVRRSDVKALRALTAGPAAKPASAAAGGAPAVTSADRSPAEAKRGPERAAPLPAYREVTIPAGTVLAVELRSAVSSDKSRVEDRVQAALRRPVTVGGVEALPVGTPVIGHVTAAERSARVKGRAFVAFRFTGVDPPGDAERVSIRTDAITRLAPATRKQDAAKIGGGAVGGAIIGGILGGGDGAAKGAAAGGAAGTGVVLSTRGKEIRLGPGADIAVRLAAPVTLRVREG
jgi:hypothetical protein